MLARNYDVGKDTRVTRTDNLVTIKMCARFVPLLLTGTRRKQRMDVYWTLLEMTDIKFLFLGLTVTENKFCFSEYHSVAFNALCLWGGG